MSSLLGFVLLISCVEIDLINADGAKNSPLPGPWFAKHWHVQDVQSKLLRSLAMPFAEEGTI